MNQSVAHASYDVYRGRAIRLGVDGRLRRWWRCAGQAGGQPPTIRGVVHRDGAATWDIVGLLRAGASAFAVHSVGVLLATLRDAGDGEVTPLPDGFRVTLAPGRQSEVHELAWCMAHAVVDDLWASAEWEQGCIRALAGSARASSEVTS